MSQLSPELKDLVLAARQTNAPTMADSARIYAAVFARLSDAIPNGVHAAPLSPSLTAYVLGTIVALTLGGIPFLAAMDWATPRLPPELSATEYSEATQRAAPSTTPDAPAVTLSRTPATSATPSEPIAAAMNAPEPASERILVSPATPRRQDRLAEEVALLSRAETALHGGKPGSALVLLNEHERLFARGLLSEERVATRIQALCALGRVREANAQQAQLSPKSVHGEPSRRACRVRATGVSGKGR